MKEEKHKINNKKVYIIKRNLKVSLKDTARSIKKSKFIRKTLLPSAIIIILIYRLFATETASPNTIENLNILLLFLGLVLTGVSIDDSRRLQEASFLVKLNTTFVENSAYTRVYEYLENNLHHKKNNRKLKASEVSQYLTFFETLYVLVKEHSVSIDEFDDLFGYRFFLAVNDDDIWNIKLSNHNNFKNIYEFEYRWFNYRVDRGIPILGKTYEIGDLSFLERKLNEKQ